MYAPMTVARAKFALVWSPDGRLFAVGGVDDKRKTTSSVEMLDCAWDVEEEPGRAWKLVAPMNQNRRLHGACFFEDKIFVAGGKGERSVECFVMPSADFPSGQWTMVQPMIRTIILHGLLTFGEGLLGVGELHTLYLNLRPVVFILNETDIHRCIVCIFSTSLAPISIL